MLFPFAMVSAEKREFDKYLKFLTAKACQIVVRSRQGGAVRTSSSARGNDWFNLAIPDERVVTGELKRELDGHLPHHGAPFCVEISMGTAEGDSVVLEVWSVNFDPSKRDISVSVPHLLYPRLSLMLKSLIALCRATPTYPLSRHRNDLKFTFRVYLGPPELGSQAPAFTHVQFAETLCPYGSISMAVHYRKTITLPSRTAESTSQVPSLSRESSNNSESLSGEAILLPPFAASAVPVTQHTDSQQPFAAILHPVAPAGEEVGGAQVRRGDGEGEGASTKPLPERDGYVMVDLTEIRPAFPAVHSDRDELSELLQQCRDAPTLHLFEEGSMDVTAAIRLVEEQEYP